MEKVPMSDRVLPALRQLRAIEPKGDRPSDARELLEIVLSATASARATLLLPDTEPIQVGGVAAEGAQHLELRFPSRDGFATLVLEHASSGFDPDDAAAEILGGEVVVRLDRARAEREASRSHRQVDLLRALSRAAAEALRLPEIADSVARELLSIFAGAHVAVHVVAEDHLELVARRAGNGGMDTAPEWLRRLPRDGASLMAVAAREQRIVSRSVNDLPEPPRSDMRAQGLRHVVAVPLLFDGSGFGAVTVTDPSEMPWDPEALGLLAAAAVQLGVDFGRVRLLEDERRRAQDLGLINELGSLFGQHLALADVLSTAVNELARVTDVPRVHVFLVDASGEALRGVACTEELAADALVALTAGSAVAQAFKTRAPVAAELPEADPDIDKTRAAQIGLRSVLALPLVSRGEAIGVIALGESRHPRAFTKYEVARAVAVANLIAPAVANAKMFDDLRQSYEALARTQAELVTHERLAALGQLSAVIAHEVRNPLAIIFNSLGSLRRLEPLPPDAKLLLDIVGEEASRLNRIVGDLLDFVRPYSSHPRTVKLDAIVAGAVEAAQRAAPDANVEVKTVLRLPNNELFLDGTMLQQALINLIVNAVQATPKGKTVTVSAWFCTIAEAEGASATSLRCEVEDEGPGIDDDDAARVFQPFFTTKATGTGLGLAVVARIAQALGGVVEVARAPSGGSKFTLTVPLVTVARAEGPT
jgi:signal transduction histidine kinase